MADEKSSKRNILIAYFSWSGNVQGIAEQIQTMTGADLFRIETVTPYSKNYDTVLEKARSEKDKQARPELNARVEDMGQYDTIILGHPNWWSSFPMPVASFLEGYNFSGKTILHFCSHGGGGFGQSHTAMAKLAPDAILIKGLSVQGSGTSSLPDEIKTWLSSNGII